MTSEKNLTEEFISEITQGLINQNNKWFEERKQAREEFLRLYTDLKYSLIYISDEVEKCIARKQLEEMKACMYRM